MRNSGQNLVSALILCAMSGTLEAQALNAGSAVCARWTDGSWYAAKIVKVSGQKFDIEYLDGTKESTTKDLLIPFSKDIKLKAGQKVMAMWAKNYGFYEATVKSVGKGEALVAWADGSADESVPFDRILTNLSAFAAAPASGSKSSASTAGGSSVDVYLDGSLVGEIESDGTIRASGSIVGKFETDGSLRIDGSIVGKVEKNGNIRKGGSIVGKVEADGTVYRGGSIIGEIASDGTIYSEGSIIGEAEGGNAAKIAALIFFFPLFED